MGTEFHAVLGDLAQFRQGKHLKSAGIGEDRPIPVHEGMQISRLGDEILAGTQVQVVGIGKNDLRVAVLQLVGGHGFHAGLGAHGHEDGGLDHAVGRMQPAPASAGFAVYVKQFEFKSQFCVPPGFLVC